MRNGMQMVLNAFYRSQNGQFEMITFCDLCLSLLLVVILYCIDILDGDKMSCGQRRTMVSRLSIWCAESRVEFGRMEGAGLDGIRRDTQSYRKGGNIIINTSGMNETG